MNLTYKWNNAPSKRAPGATVSQKNFFKFYEENRKDVDLILAARSHYYANLTGVDFDELRSEILMRLMNSKFLGSFDPSKNILLNTYLTNTVNGAATHALRAMLHKPYWRDEDGVRYRWNRINVAELNSSNDPEDEHMLRQLPSEDTWEQEFETENLVDTLRSKMSDRDTEILDCLLDGLDKNGIATKFGINRMACASRVYSMRKNAVTILNKKDGIQIKEELSAAVESYRNKQITWCKLAPSLVNAVEAGIALPEFKTEKGLNSTRYNLMITCYRFLEMQRPEALNRFPAPPLDNIGRVMNLSAKVSGNKFAGYIDRAITGELSCRKMKIMIREMKEIVHA